jgi:hypothetical protein
MNELKPGTYKLMRDVPAFSPDKRKRHDWRAKTLKAGKIIIVRNEPYPDLPDVPVLRIYPSGEYSHYSVAGRDFPADALEPIVETPSHWLRREHAGLTLAAAMLDELVEQGLVTMEQIQEVADAVLRGDDADLDP